MATNKLVAAESIRTLATRYKDMVEVANLLESIGTIEQASNEADAACKIAQIARDESLIELRELKESIRTLESDYAQKKLDAKADIDLMLSSAMDERNKIIREANSKANSKADDILKKANETASITLSTAEEKLNRVQTKLSEVMSELDSVVEARNKAEEEAQAAESRLNSVQDRIRKLAQM